MSIQLFLAHASEDKAAVLDLYERLKAQGYQPWVDKKNLIPGQNWREEIPKAICNSQLFIACLSSRSVSKEGYVQKELRLALNTCAEKPPGSIYLIPLKLEPCDVPDICLEQLSVRLRDLHWVDYWEPDGFDTLVRAIDYQIEQLQGSETNVATPSTAESSTPHPPSSPLSESARPTQTTGSSTKTSRVSDTAAAEALSFSSDFLKKNPSAQKILLALSDGSKHYKPTLLRKAKMESQDFQKVLCKLKELGLCEERSENLKITTKGRRALGNV